MIKLKSILNEGKRNAKDIKAGDVFIKDAGYGKATYVAMGSLKQSKRYKNEYDIFSTVLVPGKKGKSKFNEKGAETYVTFSPKYGKFSDVEYVGHWNAVSKNYQDD